MEGIAVVINGFDLRAIVATELCYNSNIAILMQRALRANITIRIIDLSERETLGTFEAGRDE